MAKQEDQFDVLWAKVGVSPEDSTNNNNSSSGNSSVSGSSIYCGGAVIDGDVNGDSDVNISGLTISSMMSHQKENGIHDKNDAHCKMNNGGEKDDEGDNDNCMNKSYQTSDAINISNITNENHDEELHLKRSSEGSGSTQDDSSFSKSSNQSVDSSTMYSKKFSATNAEDKSKTRSKGDRNTTKEKTHSSFPQLNSCRRGHRRGAIGGRGMKHTKRFLWSWQFITFMISLMLIVASLSIFEYFFRRPMKERKTIEAAKAKEEKRRQKELEEELNKQILENPKDTILTAAGGGSASIPGTAGPEDNYVVEWIEPIIEKPTSYGKGQRFPSSNRANIALNLLSQLTDIHMLDGETPQNDAAYWMIATDAQQIQPGVSQQIDMRFVQRYTLATMYYSLQGSKWKYDNDADSQLLGLEKDPTSENNTRTRWTNDTVHECQWWGVQCNTSNRVTSIKLNGLNLSGTIPSEIQFLYNMETLDLYRNQISGRIPDLPPTLRYIDFERNQLTGPVPESLYYLHNLEDLYLSNNQLTGTLSKRLGSLTQLVDFRIWDNKFQGQIPTTVGQLNSLRKFMVYQNKLSGTIPSEFGLLNKTLWKLDLGNNRIGGQIPSELGNLSALSHLLLHENRLRGTFPNEIGPKISHLYDVWFYNNALTGTLPIGLGNHSQIHSILAHGNKFHGNASQLLCLNDILWEMTDFTSDCFSEFVRCDCCYKCY